MNGGKEAGRRVLVRGEREAGRRVLGGGKERRRESWCE